MDIHNPTIIGRVIGEAQLKDELTKILTDAGVTTTQDIDWSAYSGFVFTMIANTVFSDVNLPGSEREAQKTILMTGAFTPTWPAYYKEGGDAYDGAVWNQITLESKAGANVVLTITNLT